MEQIKGNNQEDRKIANKAEAILEGAMREFLAQGYSATSMDRIAAAAGVSKATVYSHFRDKETLFNALFERISREKLLFVFSKDFQPLQGEPAVILRRLAKGILDIAANDQQVVDIMRLVIGESGRFPELANAYVRNLAKPGIETLSQYLESRRELNISDPEATARMIIGSLVYFVILQNVMQGKDILPMKPDRFIDSLISFVLAAKNGTISKIS